MPYGRRDRETRRASHASAGIDNQPTSAMNIGPKESRKRLRMGAAVFALGVGILVALMLTGANRWWRIVLFLPFWMGSLGFFQAMEKT